MQLKYEVPWVVSRESGGDSRSGLGNSEVGIKWRFFDGGKAGYLVSFYPQVEFNNPGSSSDERGLVEPGTAWMLPLEFQRTWRETDYNAEIGRTVSEGEDEWFLGLAASRPVNERFELAGEFVARTSSSFDGAVVQADVGARATLRANLLVLASIGKELRNDFERAASLQCYLALQFLVE